MIRLGDIATVITKGTTPTSLGYEFTDSGVNFIKIESIADDGSFIPQKFAYISDECNEKLKRSQLQENDILFSIAGAIGKTVIVTKDALPANTNQALSIIRIPPNTINYQYLICVLQSQFISEQFEKQKQGVAQLNLSLKNIADLKIPLVSKEKQLEVVEHINKIESLISSCKQQIIKLDELVKARFVELFGLPVSNSMNWETEKMQSIAPSQNYLGEMPTKVWLLNLDMVESQTGRIIEYLIVPKDEVGNSTCVFDDSTVLYSKLRPYLNKVVIPDRCGYATSELIPLKPNTSKINREYLAYMLRSDEFVSMISEKVAGAKMPRVSMGDFRNFDVPVPPKELQNEFANFVKQTDKSKFEVQQSLEKLETLKKSLMQQYFG